MGERGNEMRIYIDPEFEETIRDAINCWISAVEEMRESMKAFMDAMSKSNNAAKPKINRPHKSMIGDNPYGLKKNKLNRFVPLNRRNLPYQRRIH
jgi:hypothetical protein